MARLKVRQGRQQRGSVDMEGSEVNRVGGAVVATQSDNDERVRGEKAKIDAQTLSGNLI